MSDLHVLGRKQHHFGEIKVVLVSKDPPILGIESKEELLWQGEVPVRMPSGHSLVSWAIHEWERDVTVRILRTLDTKEMIDLD